MQTLSADAMISAVGAAGCRGSHSRESSKAVAGAGLHGLHRAQEHGSEDEAGGLRHFMDPNYYMPGYPLNPPVFRAGLAWHFYK